MAHFLGLAKRAGAGDFDRDAQLLERARVRLQRLLLAREDQEIAELATLGVDFRADVARDGVSLGFLRVAVAGQRDGRERRAGRGVAVRVERREHRRLRRGVLGEQRLEHAVRPRAERRARTGSWS